MATSSAFTPSFDESLFRQSIVATMRMGMPQSDEHKIRWYWNRDQTFVPDDPAGNPYDWTDDPVTDAPGNPTGDPSDDGLIVDYAVEFNSSSGLGAGVNNQLTPLGPIDPTRMTVTVFDVDYDRIKTADYAAIGTTRYRIRYAAPPVGLFGVTVHDLYLEADDQAASA